MEMFFKMLGRLREGDGVLLRDLPSFYHCFLKPNIFSHPSSSSFYWTITYISHLGDIQTFYNIHFSHIFIQDCGSYTLLTGVTYRGVNLTWMSHIYDKINLKPSVLCQIFIVIQPTQAIFFKREFFLESYM